MTRTMPLSLAAAAMFAVAAGGAVPAEAANKKVTASYGIFVFNKPLPAPKRDRGRDVLIGGSGSDVLNKRTDRKLRQQ
jgi:hypothetical protein